MPSENKQPAHNFLPISATNRAQQAPTSSISSLHAQEQFADTPRFGLVKEKKNVQWHDDCGVEDSDSSPTLPTRPHFRSPMINQGGDAIFDDDEDDTTWAYPSSHSNTRKVRRSFEGDVVTDTIEVLGDSESSANELTNPLPRKRRQPHGRERNAIQILSSPSQHRSPLPSRDSDDLEDYDRAVLSSPGIRSPTAAKTPLRFRSRKGDSSNGDGISSSNRPSFRIPLLPPVNGNTPDSALPDTFSPSRRRGKGKEYASGGLADTLRGWIIGMTAGEQGQKHLAHLGTAPSYKRILEVSEVEKDENNRCTLVKGNDGNVVMLLGGGRDPRKQILHEGSRIGLCGGPMYWEIETSLSPGQYKGKLGISALWDVLET